MVFGFVNVIAVIGFIVKVNVIFGIAIAFGSGDFFGNGRDRDGLVAAQQGVDGGFVFGDFAQGDDRDLVAFCGNKGLVAVGNLSRAAGGGEYEAEAVVFVFEAVFDGDAGHGFSVCVLVWGKGLHFSKVAALWRGAVARQRLAFFAGEGRGLHTG